MSALRRAWDVIADMRGPLALTSVGIKLVRQLLWLPLLYDLITWQPVTLWTYIRFWLYVVLCIVLWFIDTLIDADGDEK